MGKTTGQTQFGHRHCGGANPAEIGHRRSAGANPTPHARGAKRGAHPRHEGTAWNHVPTKRFPTRRSVEEAIGREVRDGIA